MAQLSIHSLRSSLAKHPGRFFFLLMCVVGLFTFHVYGVSWDEGTQRLIGTKSWNYVFNGDNSLKDFIDRDYGVAFELPLIMIEKMLGLTDAHDIFLMRHLLAHLFFLLGALFCYKLICLLYDNKVLGLIGFLLFVLHPHLYAHSFFNTKDVPFLTMFMICFYLTAKAFQNKTVLNFAALGACLGLLINMRIMGVLLLLCVLFFLIVDCFREKETKRNLISLAILIVTGIGILIATWPYLWHDPIQNFKDAFANMSRFRWSGLILFRGQQIRATEIGWNYIPVWFSITTPIPYLIGGILGIGLTIFCFLRAPLEWTKTLQGKCNLIFLGCFVGPVLAVIVLKSVLYDQWRQLYFIYPGFMLLGVFALNTLIEKHRKMVLAASAAAFLYVGGFMAINMPFQHAYFNLFVAGWSESEHIRKNYDIDYWGTSFKQSLEYILKTDHSPLIGVCPAFDPGKYNINFLAPELRRRFRVVPFDSATYYITTFREHPGDFPFEDKRVHSIRVLDNTINAVYKLK